MLARVRRALRSSVTLQTTKNDSQTRIYTGVGAIRGLVRWITGISCRELINGRRFSTSGEERVTLLGTEDSYRWYGFIDCCAPGRSDWIKISGDLSM